MCSIPLNYHKSTSRASFDIISRPIDTKKHAQSNATLRITRIPSNKISKFETAN